MRQTGPSKFLDTSQFRQWIYLMVKSLYVEFWLGCHTNWTVSPVLHDIATWSDREWQGSDCNNTALCSSSLFQTEWNKNGSYWQKKNWIRSRIFLESRITIKNVSYLLIENISAHCAQVTWMQALVPAVAELLAVVLQMCFLCPACIIRQYCFQPMALDLISWLFTLLE